MRRTIALIALVVCAPAVSRGDNNKVEGTQVASLDTHQKTVPTGADFSQPVQTDGGSKSSKKKLAVGLGTTGAVLAVVGGTLGIVFGTQSHTGSEQYMDLGTWRIDR